MVDVNVTPIRPRTRPAKRSENPFIASDPRDTLDQALAVLAFLSRAELGECRSDEILVGRDLCFGCVYDALQSLAPVLECARVSP